MRVRDDLATMFCNRVATKIKRAKAELEEIRLREQEMVEALIGNYRTVLKHIDAGGPARAALARAAVMTAEAVKALEGLDEEASAEEVAERLGGKVSPAVVTLAEALAVQAGGLVTVTAAVEGFGGFAGQYEQIEKVSAHHGNFWEVFLYGQIGRDRSVMFDLAEFDAGFFRRQLEDKLRNAAAAADSGYPDNEGLVVDTDTGVPTLKQHRAETQRPSAKKFNALLTNAVTFRGPGSNEEISNGYTSELW
jgi:hypothetical protein